MCVCACMCLSVMDGRGAHETQHLAWVRGCRQDTHGGLTPLLSYDFARSALGRFVRIKHPGGGGRKTPGLFMGLWEPYTSIFKRTTTGFGLLFRYVRAYRVWEWKGEGDRLGVVVACRVSS